MHDTSKQASTCMCIVYRYVMVCASSSHIYLISLVKKVSKSICPSFRRRSPARLRYPPQARHPLARSTAEARSQGHMAHRVVHLDRLRRVPAHRRTREHRSNVHRGVATDRTGASVPWEGSWRPEVRPTTGLANFFGWPEVSLTHAWCRSLGVGRLVFFPSKARKGRRQRVRAHRRLRDSGRCRSRPLSLRSVLSNKRTNC